jgi:hypothetical protein
LTNREKNHKACWIKGLNTRNLKPAIKLLETCNVEIAHEREDVWIRYYRDKGHQLTNLEAPAKTPCLNRPQTDAEIHNNREKQLDRNKEVREVKYHGVHICNPNSKVPYRASLRIKTKRHHLGQWDNPEDAAKAWDSAMAYYFPAHSLFNFPDTVTPKSIEEIKKTTTAATKKSSKYKGVTYRSKSQMWMLIFSTPSERVSVGTFTEEEQAASYYDSLQLYYSPDNPTLNFPDQPNQPLSVEEVRKISRELKGMDATPTSKYPYIFYQKRENKWAFEINKKRKGGFPDELSAVRGFNNYVTTNYINKPLIKLINY